MITSKVIRERLASTVPVLVAVLLIIACGGSGDSGESALAASAPTETAVSGETDGGRNNESEATEERVDRPSAESAAIDAEAVEPPHDDTAEASASSDEGATTDDEGASDEDEAAAEADEAAAIDEAVEIGNRFMAARHGHDVEAIAALLAPDVAFGGAEFARSPDEFPLQLEWERVMGWQFLEPTCSAGTPDRVVCAYAIHDPLNERAGKGPFSGNSFLLEFADGLVERSSHNFYAEISSPRASRP